MTILLEKAFKKAANLPEIEQNALAKWLIDEIKSDKKWDTIFADSEDILEKLAIDALNEHKKGKTSDLDIEKL